MKKSEKVVLTTLFLAAISACNAMAQDMDSRRGEPGNRSDSTQSHHSSHAGAHTGGHGFFGFLHRNHNNRPNPAPQNRAPRTNGFGNTLRMSAGS